MPISNYPNGFANGLQVRGVPILNTYAGNVFWVDSVAGSNGNKGTFERPFASIDYAVGRCTANNGDVILAKPGHVEAVIAAAGLDLDVAGITIVFMGNDNDRARINFTTDVGADMDVDAADITLINPRFTAGIDALTGPIDVNAARFTIVNGLWEDGTSIDTTDCIVADANADDMVIDGWTYRAGDEGGTQKQSQIQIAAATRPVLKNIKITGDFATGAIENGTAWIDALLENVNIDNANVSPTVAVLLQATSTGSMRYCTFRVASGTTYITANNDMQLYECFGTGTDATTGEKVGTQLSGDIEAKIDIIDGYHDVPAGDATANAQVRDVVGNKTDAAVQAIAANKSVVGYLKGLIDALMGTAGIAAWPAAAAPANGVSMSEGLRYLSENQAPRFATKSTGDLTAFGTSLNLFTVTGDVLVKVGCSVDVAVTSTSGTTTLEIGVAGNTACLCVQDAVDNTAFAIGDSWTLDTAADANGAQLSSEWVLVGNGATIILTGSVDDITAGDIDVYCLYMPLSSDGAVAAA